MSIVFCWSVIAHPFNVKTNLYIRVVVVVLFSTNVMKKVDVVTGWSVDPHITITFSNTPYLSHLPTGFYSVRYCVEPGDFLEWKRLGFKWTAIIGTETDDGPFTIEGSHAANS